MYSRKGFGSSFCMNRIGVLKPWQILCTHVRIYVCMHACRKTLSICMCVCIYVCMHACMHKEIKYMYVCMHICTNVCMYACIKK